MKTDLLKSIYIMFYVECKDKETETNLKAFIFYSM